MVSETSVCNKLYLETSVHTEQESFADCVHHCQAIKVPWTLLDSIELHLKTLWGFRSWPWPCIIDARSLNEHISLIWSTSALGLALFIATLLLCVYTPIIYLSKQDYVSLSISSWSVHAPVLLNQLCCVGFLGKFPGIKLELGCFKTPCTIADTE